MGVREVVRLRAPFHTSAFIYRNTPALRRMIFSRAGWRAGSYDLWLFACAACQGRLRNAGGEASFYRKHGQGITATGLFAVSNIHRLRMLNGCAWPRCVPVRNGRILSVSVIRI
ncbi:MAG: hypothetical protein IPG69_15690 [Flavobacteriales bacterium]|nr:hypothetical protein [Flavobacteriales bacterium]